MPVQRTFTIKIGAIKICQHNVNIKEKNKTIKTLELLKK